MLQSKSEKSSKTREIPFGRPWISIKEKEAVLNVLDGHILTHGNKCTEFENKFSSFIGGGYPVSTSSCMAALHLSTLSYNLGAGDEVIVPAQTHVATVHAVELLGATPVFVDSELETGNIDIDKLEAAITTKTKAVILVHFVGIPVRMDRICLLAKQHNLAVIEDCALALGAYFKNKHVGLWGDTGCFSFYPVKHITTGEGGMFISRHCDIAKSVASFRAFNVDRSFKDRVIPGVYDVTGVGLNYRMSEIQAALGCEQLDKLSTILKRRKQNFERLKSLILTIPNILVLDSVNEDCVSSYYCLSAILVGDLALKRNEIITYLTKNKIGCSVYYPKPVPKMEYYARKYGYKSDAYPNAEIISEQGIALPVGPHLNLDDMDLIFENLKEAL